MFAELVAGLGTWPGLAVLEWSGKSLLVGCKFGEGEGEVVESVCQLKHLGERHVVVTERHVVS